MINITDKTRCTGCTACMNVCPSGCIQMREDAEGFLYPVADMSACISCGGCLSVCPFNLSSDNMPRRAFAVRTPHEDTSSSGGAVSWLSDRWIAEGGVVYGAAFDEDLTVCHIKADSSEALQRLKTSKYVQSRLDGIFASVRRALDDGERVLFIGTPCQVAGLKSFLGNESCGNILTIQLACHGVPAPKLWKRYLESVNKMAGDKVLNVNFRDKSAGWKNYRIAFQGTSSHMSRAFDKDTYMLAYLQNLSLRPSCYHCDFRANVYADILAGDFWNISEVLPEQDNGRGVTLVAAGSEKGQEIIERTFVAAGQVLSAPVPLEKATVRNSGFGGVIDVPEHRDKFFEGLYDSDDVMSYMDRFVYRPSQFRLLCQKIRSFLSRIKRRIVG